MGLSLRHYFLKKSVAVMLLRGFAACSALAMTISISRTLSTYEAGLFFLAMSIITALGSLSTMGFTTTLVRYVAKFADTSNWTVVNGVVRHSIKITLIFSVSISCLLFIFASDISEILLKKPNLSMSLRVLLLALPFLVLTHLIAHAFQGLHRQLISVSLLNIIPPISVLALVSASSIARCELTAQSTSYFLASGIILAFILAFSFWYKQDTCNVKASDALSREFAKSARPIWWVIIMSSTVQWSALFIVSAYVAAEDLAIYSVAHRVSLLVSLVLISINSVASPSFAAVSRNEDRRVLRQAAKSANRLIILFGLPCICLILFSSKFIMSLFGSEYIEGAVLLNIFILGQAVNVLTGSVGVLLNMVGMENDLRNAVFTAGGVAVCLSLLLTPGYGVFGAAVATSLAIATQNLICSYFVWRRLKISIFDALRFDFKKN